MQNLATKFLLSDVPSLPAKYQNIRMEIQFVTPERASALLERNTGNRKLRRSRVAMHKARISLGVWKLTHQGICVADSGRLLDGQHRLEAIVETGKGQWLLVATGFPEDVYDAIDGGAPRSLADRTQLDERKTQIATVICRVLYGFGNRAIPEQIVEQVVEAFNPEMEVLSATCNTSARGRSIAPFRAAAVLSMARDANDYAAQEYRNFVLWSDDAAPVVKAVIRQVMERTGAAKIARGNDTDALVRGWKMFERRNRDNSKVQINDPSVQIEEMRAVAMRRVDLVAI